MQLTQRVIQELKALGDEEGQAAAFTVLESILSAMSAYECSHAWHDWEDTWARAKQLPPDGGWRSWGALTGRAFGKTRSFAEYVNREAMSGRAMRIALIAQNEDKCKEVLISGEAGLIACSPPWCRAEYTCDRVLWPNGAQAFVYTPERPGDIYGPEHHLAWCSEIHAWPRATMAEAWSALRMGLRLGYGRMVWDSNPKRRHPILRALIQRGMEQPYRHVVIRGTSYENADNMTPEALAEWEAEYGGTQKGREMLLGEQVDDEEGALFKQAWIDDRRRHLPEKFKTRIISLDPAISARKGSDLTGIVEGGLGLDDQCYVYSDQTGKLAWEAWGQLVVQDYLRRQVDFVLVERNRGGDACAANLRACGKEHGVSVVVVSAEDSPHHTPGLLYVKEIVARGTKDVRAEPVASSYERGRVSHVIGADLTDLEEQMTTWVPSPQAVSPNNLDAAVHMVWELLQLGRASSVDHSRDGAGLAQALAQIQRPSPARDVGRALMPTHRFGRVGRI